MKGLEKRFQTKLGYRFAEFSIAKFAKEVQQLTLVIHDKYDKIAPLKLQKHSSEPSTFRIYRNRRCRPFFK